jgi:hypothetical protein
MWRGGVGLVVLSVGGALACGGRYEHNPTDVDPEMGGSASAGTGIVTGGGGAASNAPSGGSVAVAGSGGTISAACVEQGVAFQEYWSRVMTEFGDFRCMTDGDCRSYYFQSECDPTCRLLTSAAHRGIVDRLNSFGTVNCSPECWPQPWPSCPAVAPVSCIAGRCQ